MDNKKSKQHCLLPGLLAISMIPLSTEAAPKVAASATLALDHTSNVSLTSDNDNEATAYRLSPRFSISEKDRLTNYTLAYQLDSLQYQDDRLDEQNRHNLLGSITNSALDKRLKTNLSYQISEIRKDTATSPNTPIVGQVGNTEETHTQSANIKFTGHQNRYFKLNAAAQGSSSKSMDSQFESENFGFNAGLSNGSALSKHSWETSAAKQYFDGDQQTQSVNNSFSGNAEFHVINDWFVRAQGNYRKLDVDTTADNNVTTGSYGAGASWRPSSRSFLSLTYNIDSEDDDEFFAGAFRWQPSKRTSFSGSVSKEVFGKTYQFAANHNTRLLVNSVSYQEQLTNFTGLNQVPFSIICPNTVDFEGSIDDSGCRIAEEGELPDASLGEQLLTGDIPELFSGLRVKKSLRASSGYRKGKSSVVFSVLQNREYAFPLKTGSLSSLGFDISWSLKIDSRNSLLLQTQLLDVDDETNTSGNAEYLEQRYTATYKRSLNENVDFSFKGSFMDRDTEGVDGINEYTLTTSVTVKL